MFNAHGRYVTLNLVQSYTIFADVPIGDTVTGAVVVALAMIGVVIILIVI